MSIGHACYSHKQIPKKTLLNPTHSANPTLGCVAQALYTVYPDVGCDRFVGYTSGFYSAIPPRKAISVKEYAREF